MNCLWIFSLILFSLPGARIRIGGNPVLSIPVRITLWDDGTTRCRIWVSKKLWWSKPANQLGLLTYYVRKKLSYLNHYIWGLLCQLLSLYPNKQNKRGNPHTHKNINECEKCEKCEKTIFLCHNQRRANLNHHETFGHCISKN